MKRTTKYVALDVHQATTVATVREDSGRVNGRAIVPTEEPSLLGLVGAMRGSVHVAFEEGTQAQWLHDLLSPHVDRVVVSDQRGRSLPLTITLIERRRASAAGASGEAGLARRVRTQPP